MTSEHPVAFLAVLAFSAAVTHLWFITRHRATHQIHDQTNMDTRTGKILILNDDQAEPNPHHFVRLGNLPHAGCQRCKGTGVKRITERGRRIPCECTNPKK